jgi:glycosyltransferase involved in cell wall biosynthesis
MLGDPARPGAPPAAFEGAAAAATRPAVSVVLCVRNGERTVARQLAALRAQDFAGPWELLVVDNASTDGSVAVIEHGLAGLPGRLLTERRVGLNHARNHAIAAARAPKVVLCDADDEVSPGWLRGLVAALDRFDLAGGALDVDRLNGPSERNPRHHQIESLPESLDRPYAIGANLGFRTCVWRAIGGFDGAFHGGCDETDFCLRAQDAGYSMGFEPSAVVHYRLRSRLTQIARQHFGYGRGEERMVAKRHRAGRADDQGRAARWRWLANDVRAELSATVPMLATAEGRRLFVERTAFHSGRFVELVRPCPPE